MGFETIGVAAGEMCEPKRAVPLAILLTMCVVSLLYVCMTAVAFGTLPDIAGHPNPLAAASTTFMGPAGGTIIAAGIAASVAGSNATSAFVAPRRLYAMAERGHAPALLTRVHPATGAPRNAIIVAWALSVSLSLSGTFEELISLSVMARLVQYIATCTAVLVFRRRDTMRHHGFQVPFGAVIPVAAICLSLWLLYESNPRQLLIGALALLAGAPVYFASGLGRRRVGALV